MSLLILIALLSLGLYYTVFKNLQWQFLLFVSLLLYAYYEKAIIVFILITGLSIYFAARKLEEDSNRLYLILALVLNFAILFGFKYLGVFSDLFANMGASLFESTDLFKSLALPLGISFYTFKSTSYLIDVYRKKYPAERNFFKLLLFITYFPTLLQGPIDKYDRLKKSLFKKHEIDYELFNKGALLIIFGMMKKLLVADKLSPYINAIVCSYTRYNGLTLFITMFVFGIQIYTDFSGGIDIVRGVSYLFGIDLAKNFNNPYLAVSVADYWRRWHMTLGAWMREYVFYPMSLSKPFMKLNVRSRKSLGKNYGKIFALMISTFIVYLLIGLWHGSRMISALFGIYYGIVVSLSLLLKPLREKVARKLSLNKYLKYSLQLIWVNILVSIGRYFSKASSPRDLYNMLAYTVNNFINIQSDFIYDMPSGALTCARASLGDIGFFEVLPIVFAIIVIIIVGIIREREEDIYSYITEVVPRVFTYVIIFAIVVFVMVFGVIYGEITDIKFVYMQY